SESEFVPAARPSRELRAEWNRILREDKPDKDSDRLYGEHSHRPQKYEVWAEMPGTDFAAAIRNAHRMGATSEDIQNAINCLEFSPDDDVSFSYLTLGDLKAAMNGSVEDVDSLHVPFTPEWSRWQWRANKGRPGVRVTCPCGESFSANEGHPEPSGDYWRRCVRYFLNPSTKAEKKATAKAAAAARAKAYRERKAQARTNKAAGDARIIA